MTVEVEPSFKEDTLKEKKKGFNYSQNNKGLLYVLFIQDKTILIKNHNVRDAPFRMIIAY